MATVLLSMMILGILQTMIGAYRVSAKARATDHARYFIKSFADQFLTQQTTDSAGNLLPLFTTTSATGYGLTWTTTNADGSQTVLTGGADSAHALAAITIPLNDTPGATGSSATVTRTVWYLVPPDTTTGGNPGDTTLAQPVQSAGYMLRADFTVNYTAVGQAMSNTITVVRSVP